ncbi:MAG: hypothetical protein MK066_14850, partial [Crocinitomicaceae bacterium]|nr:hypothetical protein [Crocinitomicaceae bacterium]
MKLQLTTEQVNQVLNALAQQPYIQVHELITTIQQQGNAQIQQENGSAQSLNVDKTIPTTEELSEN